MENISKEDILEMLEGIVSSKISNQQATLTFNLEDFDSTKRFQKMLNVDKYAVALYDISEFLRKFLKYTYDQKVQYTSDWGDKKELTPDYRTMEYVSHMFYQFLADNGISTDELYE